MDNTRYAFVRSLASIGGLPSQLPAGYGGVLLDSEDPNLEQGMARARQLGIKVGIWVPAGLEGGDPKAYAQKLYGLSQKYGPDVVMPDLEAKAKGAPGTAQWEWHKQFMDAWKALGSKQNMAITVMSNQDDFNYSPYVQNGVGVYVQAYGADPRTDIYDPQKSYERLLANGVPPELASVVLAQGQTWQGNGGAAWTLDDMLADPTRAAPVFQDGTPATPQANPMQDATDVVRAPTPAGADAPHTAPAKLIDAMNPAAENYALLRLRQAVAAGVLNSIPKPGIGGYSDLWRTVSSQIQAPAAAAGFKDPGYWLRQAAQAAPAPGPQQPLPMPVNPHPSTQPGSMTQYQSALAAARAKILAQLGH